jgi:ABC-type transport system substrate-binding protein
LEGLWLIDENWEPQPLLAESWDIAPDWESITFHLRKGVKFHDGTDWNAQAANFNLDQYKTAKWTGTSAWSTIDVVEDYTIRINLSEYQNIQLSAIAACLFVSPTTIQENGQDWARWHPVGTGPFEFINFETRVSLEYKRFDGYWGDKPYLDGIKYIFVAESTTQLAAMKVGEGQVLATVSEKVSSDLLNWGWDVFCNNESVKFLAPSSADPTSPLSNKLVREAIEYAIDREALATTAGFNMWTPLYQICPTQVYGYNPDIEGRYYDPEKARSLLDEAGYASGDIEINLLSGADDNQAELLAIQGWLKEIGIDVKIQLLGRAEKGQVRTEGWDGLFRGAMDYTGGEVIYAWNRSLNQIHPSVQRPEGWLELLGEAVAAPDTETRDEIAKQLTRLAYDEVMVIPLYLWGNAVVVLPGVHDLGFYSSNLGWWWTPGKAWLEKELQ